MHLDFYIRVVYADGGQSTIKMGANDGRNAVLKAMRTTKRNDVVRLSVGEGIPRVKAQREEAHKRKQAQRARRKREREQQIMVSRGSENLGNLYEYNKRKAAEAAESEDQPI